MLENEPNDREFDDGAGGSDNGAISAGTGRRGVASRPAGPPDPVTPERAAPSAPAAAAAAAAPAADPGSSAVVVPVVSFQPPQVLFQPPATASPSAAPAEGPPAEAPPAEAPPADGPEPDTEDDGGSRRGGTRRRTTSRTTSRSRQAADDGTPARPASGGRRAGGRASATAGDQANAPARASQAPGGLDAPASSTEPDGAPDDEADDGPDDGTQPGRRRRRRGGRSRTRARNGADDTDAAGADAEPAGDLADMDEDDDGADGDDESGGTAGRRRRRKRRRGSTADAERTGSEDDPPDTVVHVREPRAAASNDDVRAVKGSTRLEAKRQRRREGRESGRRRPPVVTEAEFLARREAVERTMVVRQRGDRTQIAVLEDGILVEHYVNRASHQSYVGNVYLGKVQNVLPSMEAAFVDIGKGRNAVLYAGEVNFDASGLEGQSKRIESALKSGQSVLVQVTKDPVGHKGARLTSQVSLPGRYLVYVPNASMTGISRKLPDTERTRLKKILKKVMPEDAGVIVRTAAEGATEDELDRDVARLAAQWENIEHKAKTASAPELLYGEPDLTVRVIRDVFNEDFGELIVSGEDAWSEVDEYVRYVAPHLASRLSRWDGSAGRDAFADYRIDEQLTKAMERKVWLPSGGSLVIDRTEAMTVIDVNTGKFTGQGGNLEETVTRNNLEAAEEIVRQLRLRDVGGIIVIDFIDMVLESNRELVLRRMLECLARDRTKHQVAEVTSLGLVQMTRKRVGAGLLEAFSVPCECCNGRGVHVSLDLADLGQPGQGCQQATPAGGHSRGGGRSGDKPDGNGNGGASSTGGGSGSGRRSRGGEGRRRGGQPAAPPADALADALADTAPDPETEALAGPEPTAVSFNGAAPELQAPELPGSRRAAGPRAAGPRAPGPRAAGPRAAGPRAPGPRAPGPRAPGPRAPGRRAAGSRPPGPGSRPPGRRAPRRRAAGPGPGGTGSGRDGRARTGARILTGRCCREFLRTAEALVALAVGAWDVPLRAPVAPPWTFRRARRCDTGPRT